MTGGLPAWSSVGAPEFTAFLDATITRFSAGAPRRLTDAMRHALPLRVPIEVEAGTGRNWLEAH